MSWPNGAKTPMDIKWVDGAIKYFDQTLQCTSILGSYIWCFVEMVTKGRLRLLVGIFFDGSWLKVMCQQLISVRGRNSTLTDVPPLPFNEDVEHVLYIAPVLLRAARRLVYEDDFGCSAIERQRFINNYSRCLRHLDTMNACEQNEGVPGGELEENERDEDKLGEDELDEDESSIGPRERRMTSLPRRRSTVLSQSSSSGVDGSQSPTADEWSARGSVVAVNPESPFVDDEDYARRLQGLGRRARKQFQRLETYRNWLHEEYVEDL
ncbi:hypothetical protein LTR78_009291 [Recurvomyces mirabilis]|uniref:Uncharacterized protein n=1 Tax=Recurvomyces mirabilis TaxID=574656 RepID=A0AAE0TNV6_9PEZI|nr:hypothetical protein LTR78_009291 [Recurvomyces mirabilis]KAK5156148.1 hypothetical protein LTS14_005035 [Recurvomyces mirabilis]